MAWRKWECKQLNFIFCEFCSAILHQLTDKRREYKKLWSVKLRTIIALLKTTYEFYEKNEKWWMIWRNIWAVTYLDEWNNSSLFYLEASNIFRLWRIVLQNSQEMKLSCLNSHFLQAIFRNIAHMNVFILTISFFYYTTVRVSKKGGK